MRRTGVRLYEQGVDLIHIGAYVRRWHRWAKSGLRDSGEKPAWEVLRPALRAVVALFLRFGPWLALSPAFACQTIGDAADDARPPEHEAEGSGTDDGPTATTQGLPMST